MRWSQDHEDSLQVIGKIFARQLGLPEDIIILTDWSWWQSFHPEDKHDPNKLTGLSCDSTRHIFVNVDKCSNFYDCVSCLSHEMWHLRRPQIKSEYRINRLAEKWINCNLYAHIPDMTEV